MFAPPDWMLSKKHTLEMQTGMRQLVRAASLLRTDDIYLYKGLREILSLQVESSAAQHIPDLLSKWSKQGPVTQTNVKCRAG